MSAGLKIWDASGNLVLDTNDRIVGGIVSFSTGQTNGSYTITPDEGQDAGFVYDAPTSWFPSNRRSPWPTFTRSGNTLSWAFDSLVPEANRMPVLVRAVTY